MMMKTKKKKTSYKTLFINCQHIQQIVAILRSQPHQLCLFFMSSGLLAEREMTTESSSIRLLKTRSADDDDEGAEMMTNEQWKNQMKITMEMRILWLKSNAFILIASYQQST